MDTTTFATIITAAGGAQVVGVAVRAFINRRHLNAQTQTEGATAAEIISRASAGIVEIVTKQRDEFRVERDDLQKVLDRYVGDVEDIKRFIAIHREWDLEAQREIEGRGGQIHPPPAVPAAWVNLLRRIEDR